MDSTWIKGVVGDKLLLKSTSGDNSEWFTYDPVTGEQAVLYTESSSVLQPAAVYGQTLVYQKGDHFHLLDLSTGQDTELAGYTVPDQAVSYVNLYYADVANYYLSNAQMLVQTHNMRTDFMYWKATRNLPHGH